MYVCTYYKIAQIHIEPAYYVDLTCFRLGGYGVVSRGSAQVFVPTSCDNNYQPLGPVTFGDFLNQSIDS